MSGDPAGPAYADHLERVLLDEPEMRLARAVVPSVREPRAEALFVLETLLLDAALDVRDVGVATAKLAWWHDELARARGGIAHHPVALRLRELGIGSDAGLERRVEAAVAIAQLESPPDDAALLAPLVRFASACAGAGPGDAGEGVDALAAAHLAMRMRRWRSFAEPQRARIPLSTLARADVSREAAVSDVACGAAAIEAIAAALASRLERPVTGADVRVVCARHVLRAMRRDPRVAAAGGARARPLPLLWALWRSARRERAR